MDIQLPEALIQPVLPDIERIVMSVSLAFVNLLRKWSKGKAVAGRRIKMVRTDFTDQLDAQKVSNRKTAICKHSQNTFTYHKKLCSVQNHMKNCKPIVRLMNCTVDQDKPEWYKELKCQPKKWSANKSWAASKLHTPAKLMKSSDYRVYGLPKLTNDDIKKLKAYLDKH